MTIATHSPVFKRLGKARIARAETRLQRLREVPNLTFLRYSDYRALSTDSHGCGREYGYVTRAGGNVCYGDLKEGDCPDCAESYLRALSTDDTDSGEVYFYVPYASGSDYSGSLVEKSNYSVFTAEYGKDNEWVFSAYGGYSTYAAVVGLTGLLTCADDTFDSICEALEGLADYPLLDEEAHSTLEMECADSAWNSWAADDFKRAVEKKFDGCAEFDWPSDDELRVAFEQFAEKANCYWYDEGYGQDNVIIDLDTIVEGIDLDDLAAYTPCYVVTYFDGGWAREEFSVESEANGRVVTLRAAGNFEATYTIEKPVKK